jgi:hypothetical protein
MSRLGSSLGAPYVRGCTVKGLSLHCSAQQPALATHCLTTERELHTVIRCIRLSKSVCAANPHAMCERLSDLLLPDLRAANAE